MTKKPSTIWIFAGESSGDAYGARLACELRTLAPELCLRGMGGMAMREAGVELMVDSTDLAVVGFVEVVRHLPTFYRIFHDLVSRAQDERPDCVVLIDYPGFNLRFAAKMHGLGIRVVYYVSPQVWAWGKRRIPRIARIVDKMLVIFPFEPEVFAGTGLDVEFVGHPLIEILNALRDPELARDQQTLLLLPGSRVAEIEKLLPSMLQTVSRLHRQHPAMRYVISAPSQALAERIKALVEKGGDAGLSLPAIPIAVGRTRHWLQQATAGLAASGTVTIEAAILGLPLVVVYRVNSFTYWLARMLVNIPFFTMVNVVVGRLVYEEFLQGQVCPTVLVPAVEAILPGGARRALVEQGMAECLGALGGNHDIARRTAEQVLKVAM